MISSFFPNKKRKASSSSSKPIIARSKPKRQIRSSKGTGVQQERLVGDGVTFTLDTPMPRTKFAAESPYYTMNQSYTQAAFLTTSTSTPIFAQAQVLFSNIDQYAALASIFDQYRILEVEYWVVPEVSSAVSSASGLLSSVIDMDDGNALASFNQAGDYANCVTTPGKIGHYRHFVPHVSDALYSGAFTSYGSVASPWIDTTSSGVYHFGMKCATPPTSQAYVYDLLTRVRIQFRNVR